MDKPTRTPGWSLSDIHHVGLTVSDVERSIEFYRDVLGMELIRRRPSVTADYVARQTGYDDVELDVASFRVGPNSSQSLEIVQYMKHSGRPSDQATNRAGNSHLCLLVNDLRASYDDLQSRGVRFKSEPVEISAGPNRGDTLAANRGTGPSACRLRIAGLDVRGDRLPD